MNISFLFILILTILVIPNSLNSQKVVSINEGIKFNISEINDDQNTNIKGNFGISVSSTNVTCYGLCDGTITISITGGSPVYPLQIRLTYPPDLGGGIVFYNNLQESDFPFTITDLCGSQSPYLIRVRDADGHNSYSQVSIMAPAQMFVDDYNITNESCNGYCDGSVEIEFVYNAFYPIQYTWSSGESGTSNGNPVGIYSKCGGTYSVTITDNKGCTEDFQFEINTPTLLNIDSVNYTQIICSEGTGQIVIYASGGTPPYAYDIGTGFQVSNTFNNLNSGTYTITVADNMWCTKTYGPLSIQLNPAFTLTETHTNPQCYNNTNGSIDLTVTGGTPPYSYQWSNGATTEDINNLSPGTYTVTVTDASTCTSSLTINITSPPELTVTETHTNVTCYNGNNGSISLTVNGGTPGYSYNWTGPSCPCNGPILNNIKAGTYNVTVTDNNGCTTTLSITISQPPPINVNATKQDANCYNTCDGWINLTISGGTPDYTYNWTGPGGFTSTNEDIYNLCSGWYYVTITDANGCTAQRSFNIGSPPAINVTFNNVVNPTCNGYCNGSFNTSISGGTPPYTYIWDGPSCPCTGLNLTNLCAGTYTITVTDFRGCTKIANKTLVEPSGMILSETHVNVLCYGQNTGSIDLTVEGSYSLPLTYQWTGPNGYTNNTEDISNLYAGTYTVTVTEGAGCTKTLSVNITENNQLIVNANIINISCSGANDGSIDITVSGGNSPYNYQWQGPDGFTSTNEDISNLQVGTYYLTVNDILGCINDTSFDIIDPYPITIDDSINNVTCYNTSTGSIYINVNGGNPPYTYQWQGPNGFTSTNEDIINLQNGTYFLTVTDLVGCTKAAIYSISQPDDFDFSEIHQNVLCYGDNNGYINITVSSATPPYSFNWQGPNGFSSTNEDIYNLTNGDYYLTITDNNSCTFTTSITITSNSQLIISETHNNLTCYNNNSGNIDITVNGGTSPYSYSWNTGSTNEDLNNISAGIYKVTVTDSNGCKDSLTIIITQPSDIYYNSNVTPPLCYGNCNGSAIITANGGTSPYTINISGCSGYFATGNSPLSVNNLCDCGTNGYNIHIVDNNGCIKDTTFTITAPAAVDVTITEIVYNNCSVNCDATASASYTGGTTPVTLTWSNGQTGNTATNLCTGWVYVTVTDANGCKDIDSIQITAPNPINLSFTNINMSCYSPITGEALGDGIYVPDGPGCPQQCYNATVDVNFFPQGATVQNISDIQSICINMEHSFAGDLSFKITCPNNQSVILDSFDHSGGAYLGVPNQEDCMSCITNPMNCSQGTGWIYCWSQIFQQQGLLNVLDGMGGHISPVNFNNNTNYFTPEQSLSDLIGCPLNGTWTLQICDNWAIDDGWLFWWQINFNPALYNVENCNGSATVVATGGTPPYTYQWSNGDNSQTADSLCAGTYFITVTDISGCTSTSSINIQAVNIQITSINKTDAACSGICNGSATVNYSGGLEPINIIWSNGQTTQTINNLCAGWYYVTVESYGCTDVDSVLITNGYTLNVQSNITNQIKCFGNCDGSAVIFATNGTPPYSYNPSAILTNKCAGTYFVTVTDANGCSNTTSVTFVQPPTLNIDSIKKNDIQPCYGNNNGSITIYISGGVAPYQYNIGSGNQSSNTFNNLSAGTYTITITDANNCTKVTNPITIVEPSELIIDSVKYTNVFPCYGNNNGTITVYVHGGIPSYSYDIGTGQQSSNLFTNLSPGTYQVTVTDSYGCTKVTNYITITQPDSVYITLINKTNVACGPGNCTGIIEVNANGGTGPYSYTWNPNVGNGNLVNNLCAGLYYLTVSDIYGCSRTSFYEIVDTSNLTLIVTSVQNPLCNNYCNGQISVSATSGNPPYIFVWSTGDTTNFLTNLCAGNYSVTVYDDSLCSRSTNITLINPDVINTSITQNNFILCYGQCNASITINASGGTGILSYQWDDPANSTTQTLDNLCSGLYHVTVTDANGCTKLDSILIIEPTVITSNINILSNITCYSICNGSVEVNVNGGTPSYSYLWSNGVTTNIANNICAGWNYVTITDNNGCTKTDSINVSQPDSIQITFNNIGNVGCHGNCTGSATVQISGGTPSYTYLWSASANNQTSQTAVNLCGGVHYVTITDANGCTNSNYVLIQDTSNLAILLINKQDPLCTGDCNGLITVAGINGYPPYSYLWDDGSTNPTRTNLCAGTYFVTITDDSLCVKVDAITLVEPPQLNAFINIVQNILCYNECSGIITASATGGTPPYSYNWNNNSTNDTIYNVCAGTYTITITDNNGCSATAFINLSQPLFITNNFTIISPIKCYGNCDGVVSVASNGGTSPYTYSWSNGQIGNNVINVCTGFLYLTVTDNNGCIKYDSVFVPQPDSIILQFITNPAACSGICEGSATVITSGGTSPYIYIWSNGDSTSVADSLCAGNYSITVTDYNGCTNTGNVAIPDTSSLNLSIVNVINPSCFGSCNGQIEVNATGGTMPYTYSWSTGQSGNIINNLCANTYSVTLTDANNCTRILTIDLTQPTPLNDSIIILQPISCNNYCNGVIAVYPYGGTYPYNIQLNGLLNPSFDNLCAGNYQILITDANSCTKKDSIYLTEPQQINVTFNLLTPIKCYNNCNAVVQANVIGGTSPYIYSWSNNDNSNTADSLCAGTVYLTIIDNNSCIKTDSLIITQPDSLVIDFTNIIVTNCGKCVGSATAIVSGGTPSYTYQWDANALNQTTPTADSLCVNIYFITVSDANGCTVINSVNITDTSNMQINIANLNHITCAGWCDGSVSIEVTGGYPPYTYLWSNGQTTQTATNLCTGTYFVTVTDDSLCSRVEMVEITDQNILTVLANITPVECAGMCNAQITLVPQGGTPPYVSYQWSIQGLTDSIAYNLCPGTYYYTVIDANGCEFSDSVIINDQPPMQISINVVNPIKCNGDCNGVLTVNVIGAYGYNIIWNTGDTTDTITGLCAGNYSVTITGQSTCVDSVYFNLSQPQPLNINFVNIAQVGCHGDCSGQVTAVASGGVLPYNYQWGESANFATTPHIDSLCAGLYFITVSDYNQCTNTSYIEITDTSNLQLFVIDSANIKCYGNCDGWIEVQAQGGYPPYNYIWFTQPIQTGNLINNLCAGQYIVKVVDDSLCSRSRLIELTQPDSLYYVSIINSPLCYADSNGSIVISINGGTLPYSISWNTGITDTAIYNLPAGNYYLTITDGNNCQIIDTLTINNPPPISDSIKIKYPLCNKFDFTGAIYVTNIIVGNPPYSIIWNTGHTSDSLTNIGIGTYYYTITDANNCIKTDSVILNSFITVNAKAFADTTICFGDSVQIYGFGGKYFYWTPGIALSDSTIYNPYAKPSEPITYYYFAFDSICYDIDSVFVGIHPIIIVEAGENQTIIYDQTTNLSGSITGTAINYYWTPSIGLSDTTSLNTTAHPFESITYLLVAITAEGCKFTDSVRINVLPRLRIPSGITPNGDGINDVWIIDLIEKFPNCEVMIFNRWGEQLFYSRGYPENERWDGTHKGKPLPAGTYYYVILLHDEAFPDPITGPITIKH